NDDAMRAINLYLEGLADAVLEGKSSIPDVPAGEDDFVELDEEGRPRVGAARKKTGGAAKKRPRAAKPRPRTEGEGAAKAAPSPAAEASPAAEQSPAEAAAPAGGDKPAAEPGSAEAVPEGGDAP